MSTIDLPPPPYLLLTPGPLTTSESVKSTMLRDWCTWDRDYNDIVEDIRTRLCQLASAASNHYTAVLMQGSGTFSVEACIGSAIAEDGKLLVLANGAYGQRIGEIARYLKIPVQVEDFGESSPLDAERTQSILLQHPQISHVAAVHCETTTGMLNPVQQIGEVVKAAGRVYIVDAMSSFGGIEMDMQQIQADFLISSANKCIQGVPGFGFILARSALMEQLEGNARSLSLDMYAQWKAMQDGHGKWRFTSPTHTVRAFMQALQELEQEGGISARAARYRQNQRILVSGMRALGFSCLLDERYQSPIITSFLNPSHHAYRFDEFYHRLKHEGFVIYPGKVTGADTFRIGNIGDIHPQDIQRLLEVVEQHRYWLHED